MALDIRAALIGFAASPVALFVLKKLFDTVRESVRPDTSPRGLKVVITGGTKGLGRALADEFLRLGDGVVICSRSQESVNEAIQSLSEKYPSSVVKGTACDVSNLGQVESLARLAERELGHIDLWVNNAGLSASGPADITQADPALLVQVMKTNLCGSLWGSRAAIASMKSNPAGGKVFLIDGTGAWGNATPKNIAYGATKRALTQLKDSLAAQMKGSKISVHMASPGMVATDLLLGSVTTRRSAQFINVLAEDAAVVARWLAPRMRGVKGNGSYFKFLTASGVLWRLLTFRSRKNRFIKQS